MEVEIRGYKGEILELEGLTIAKNSFELPRIVYYEVKLYNAETKTTITLSQVYPNEIKIINKKEK